VIVRGSLRVPSDKSISHRALILSALADGPSRIRHILESADVHSTARVMRALGAAIPTLGAELIVGRPEGRALCAAGEELDCGNSGTSARLIAGVAAGVPGEHRFVGDASLSRRPMRRVADPLRRMGAQIDCSGNASTLPMTVRGGRLHAFDGVLDVASAQVKSALLLAGIVGGVSVSVREPSPTRDHTERMLRTMGARVMTDGAQVRLDPPARLRGLDISVPADPSSAAFMVGLAALSTEGEIELTDVGLNPLRVAGIHAICRMGARVELEPSESVDEEPVGIVRASAGSLRGITIGAREIPSLIDELPLLACLAARAEGETRVTGAAELRVKESDRIAAVVAGLQACGADAAELPDGFVVRGTNAPLRGRVVTHGDHRIAMAFGVLGASDGNAIEVDDPGCVSVSYPGFWVDLARLVA
jgi:3-phosphoshikimate 1-carboxyvinyltransferase